MQQLQNVDVLIVNGTLVTPKSSVAVLFHRQQARCKPARTALPELILSAKLAARKRPTLMRLPHGGGDAHLQCLSSATPSFATHLASPPSAQRHRHLSNPTMHSF